MRPTHKQDEAITLQPTEDTPWWIKLFPALRAPETPFLLFASQFLTAPRMVGSVIPTAPETIRRLLAHTDWSAVNVAVEYGPGTGVFTQALLDRLPAHATLVAIDTSAAFVDYLQRRIADPRLRLVHGSAIDVVRILQELELASADVIVSGLPFSTLPTGIDHAVMDATQTAIRPGGQFLVYQYSRYVARLLNQRFPRVDEEFSLRCLPPARLFWATKAVQD